MKNIAVIVYNCSTEYNSTVVQGITSYFKDKPDAHCIVSTVYIPDPKSSEFDYQYWTSVKVLSSEYIDAVIVVTNSFTDYLSTETLTKKLSLFANKPVISVSVPLELPKNYYTHTSCEQSYFQAVEHLVKKHNRKKIAFFSAELNGSYEGVERFEAYKHALEKNNLEFDPSLVYPGDFTPGTARETLLNKYKSRDEVPFDAILCVNDYTAGGVLLFCRERQIDCPKEISVIGFDDSNFALITFPTMSSINQTIPESGRKAAEIAYRVVNGEQTEKETVIESYPVYRQSCGCVSTATDSTAYYDQQGNYFEIDKNIREQTFKLASERLDFITDVNKLLNLMNTRISFENFFATIGSSMEVAKISEMFVVFYDTPIKIFGSEAFEVPSTAKLKIHANTKDKANNIIYSNDGISFIPSKSLLPEKYNDIEAGKYFLLPLYLHETNYGYIFCRVDNDDDNINSVNLKILTNVIIHAYDYTNEQEQRKVLINRNQNLNLQSKMDELTNVLNRRGFFDYGQQLLKISIDANQSGVIFFCDLDGLKKINDTYGHDMGDLSIQTEAKVLTNAFRDSDLVGRLSGDEFAVIAPGLAMDNIPIIRNRVLKLNEEYSKQSGLPFTLSISMGPVEFTPENFDLHKLLIEADKKLYEEKKIKKEQKK